MKQINLHFKEKQTNLSAVLLSFTTRLMWTLIQCVPQPVHHPGTNASKFGLEGF